MKLAIFSNEARRERRIGIVRGDAIIDLSPHLDGTVSTMMGLIERWDELKDGVADFDATHHATISLSDVHLHAPIARPGKIAAIGLNYLDHVEESGLERPKQQLWFSKASSSVNDPYAPIDIPKASEAVDYEAELVAVVGRRTKHATSETAKDAIFGYCVGNDVSVRDWQMHTPQWFLGKSFDTHGPFGPWIVTADEVGDPHDLGIRCFVNGERRQNSNTRHLVFNVFDQIAHLSRAMTPEPGTSSLRVLRGAWVWRAIRRYGSGPEIRSAWRSIASAFLKRRWLRKGISSMSVTVRERLEGEFV